MYYVNALVWDTQEQNLYIEIPLYTVFGFNGPTHLFDLNLQTIKYN